MNTIMTYFMAMGWAEFIGVVSGAICVWFFVKNHILAWPTAFITTTAFAFMFYDFKLYSDMLLQILYYTPIQVWGWWMWAKRSNETSFWRKWFWSKYDAKSVTRITTLSNPQRWAMVGLILIASIAWGQIMFQYTDANLPFLDALTVGMSIMAQFLLSKRVLENWAIWVTMDVLALGKYTMVGAYGATFLYAIYTCLATSGFIVWRKQYKLENQ